jgi:hypothetical protein
MTQQPVSYPRHRFPAEIIGHAVWLYHVFSLSLRDVELILAERGVGVTHESIRHWCRKSERLRSSVTPTPSPTRGHVIPRLGVHSYQGRAALCGEPSTSVGSCWHLGAAAPQRGGGQVFLPTALPT